MKTKLKTILIGIFLFISFCNYGQNTSSILFDGTDDYVDLGNPSGYDFDDMTVMCWLKTNSNTSSNYECILLTVYYIQIHPALYYLMTIFQIS